MHNTYNEDQWRQQLTPEQFHVCREKGTEPRFSGALLNEKRSGIYHCVCCDHTLFASEAKFDSGSGWPSFFQTIPNAVQESPDNTLSIQRIEVLCSKCNAHLGHVFSDGPQPTGLRYCINSIALSFKAT